MQAISEEQELQLYKEMFTTEAFIRYRARLEATRAALLEALAERSITDNDVRFVQGRLFELSIVLNWEKTIELNEKAAAEAAVNDEEDD